MPTKMILLNPGPVNVTPGVRKALLGPDICHREEEFSSLLKNVRARLLTIFGIARSHSVAFFSGSGTTALESMLASQVEENRSVLVLSNGVYGKRMRSILEIYGSQIRWLQTEPNDFPSVEAIERALSSDPSIHAIAMVHHETSTGQLNPLAQVASIAKKFHKTFLVDAISSLGAEAIDFSKNSIDCLVGTSGKCLHGFPGVSFVLIQKNAIAQIQKRRARSFCLDLNQSLNMAEKNETSFTPAVQVFYAFLQALIELQKESLKKRIRSYHKKSTYLVSEFEKLGIQCLLDSKNRSHVLSAFWTPKTTSYKRLHDILKSRGFVIYAGQSDLKDKIFRVSNLGEVSLNDLKRLVRETRKILS